MKTTRQQQEQKREVDGGAVPLVPSRRVSCVPMLHLMHARPLLDEHARLLCLLGPKYPLVITLKYDRNEIVPFLLHFIPN